ncbi:hypothetical protein PBAL39_02042 [Pedobacter sp. BAL39]|nr:hypothetical protein PBAL39_02042 [Pedobacter sp. BAL39]
MKEATLEKILEAIKLFVQFNGCREVLFKQSNRQDYLQMIIAGLS